MRRLCMAVVLVCSLSSMSAQLADSNLLFVSIQSDTTGLWEQGLDWKSLAVGELFGCDAVGALQVQLIHEKENEYYLTVNVGGYARTIEQPFEIQNGRLARLAGAGFKGSAAALSVTIPIDWRGVIYTVEARFNKERQQGSPDPKPLSCEKRRPMPSRG